MNTRFIIIFVVIVCCTLLSIISCVYILNNPLTSSSVSPSATSVSTSSTSLSPTATSVSPTTTPISESSKLTHPSSVSESASSVSPSSVSVSESPSISVSESPKIVSATITPAPTSTQKLQQIITYVQPPIIKNWNFSEPAQKSNNWTYITTGITNSSTLVSNWSLITNSSTARFGIANGDTPWGKSPIGNYLSTTPQYLFAQLIQPKDAMSFSQTISFTSAGNYLLQFLSTHRDGASNYWTPLQTVTVMLDDNVILRNYNPMSAKWVLQTIPFNVSKTGNNVLTFQISTTQTSPSDTTLIFTNINITPKYPDLTTTQGTWTYKGCFKDNGDRTIKNMISEKLSIQDCTQMADNLKYNTIGLQAGGQCFANNDTTNNYSSLNVMVDNSYCNPLNPGIWTNVVYQKI